MVGSLVDRAEAYSLAILLREMGLDANGARIVGTDISTTVLDRAMAATYTEMEVCRGMPAPLRAKYFQRIVPDTWEVNREVKSMASFRLLDLRYNIRSLGQFDVAFCRNVLIYFDQTTKTRIIEDIRTALKPGGYMFWAPARYRSPWPRFPAGRSG